MLYDFQISTNLRLTAHMHLSKEAWLSIATQEQAKNNLPVLPCPSCSKHALFIREDSIRLVRKAKQEVPEFSELTKQAELRLTDAISIVAQSIAIALTENFRFTANFACRNCGESVCSLGDANTIGTERKLHYIRFKSFLPDLQIFELKQSYPKSVTIELSKSFAAFLRDSTGAGSRIRTAVERLLDELNVSKHRITASGQPKLDRGGKPLNLSLGERLKQLEQVDKYSATVLGGLKDLGNQATHGSELSYVDLLEAYDLIHHVLEELYIDRAKRHNKLQASDHMSKKYR